MNKENEDLIGIDTAVSILRMMPGGYISPENLSKLLDDSAFTKNIKIDVVTNKKGEKLFPRNQVIKIYDFVWEREIQEREEEERKKRKRHQVVIGCSSIVFLIFWILIWIAKGDTPLTIFVNILLGYIINVIIYILAVFFIIAIFKTPVGVKNVIAILTSIGFSILILDRLNARFGWGWNFPDIFSVITGILSLSYFLSDRYLSRKKAG